MLHRRRDGLLAGTVVFGAIAGIGLLQSPDAASVSIAAPSPEQIASAESALETSFLVVAGGGAPSYNEIALEKNVHYFQRTLDFMGWDPAIASIFFANGNDGQATIRYIGPMGRQRFKVPQIDDLSGAATEVNVQQWLDTYPQTAQGAEGCPAFFYFTGHGIINPEDDDNNALILWEEDLMTVQDLGQTLDQWPAEIPFVTMMAQCFSGSFANLIYEGGDPTQPIAMQSRCGFFATVKTRPSVGCTPMVNEADYRDYSSSFFAGLSGRDRIGNPVASADYDDSGTISYAEAHAFAKVDEETPDWPISTSEAWLQRQASETDQRSILDSPIQTVMASARPEQQYVIESLVDKLGYDMTASFASLRAPRALIIGPPQEVLTAYYMRLQMELINVGMEQKLRGQGNPTAIATLDKLLMCESGNWQER